MQFRSFGVVTRCAAALLVAAAACAALAGDRVPGGGQRPAPQPLQLVVGDVNLAAMVNLLEQPPEAFSVEKRYVLQLDGPVTPGLSAELEAIGVQLGENYLPPNSFIVDLGGVAPAALQVVDGLTFLGEYQDAWRVSPFIGGREYYTELRQELDAAGQYMVDITLLAGMDLEQSLHSIEGVGAVQVTNWYELGENWVVTAALPKEALGLLSGVSQIQFVEETPDVTFRNNVVRWVVQSNVTNVTPMYDNGIRGEGQIVGVLDSHLDRNHCSFFDSQPIGPDHRKIVAYNTAFGASFHGTHVSGTIAGDAGNDTATRGVAYMAKIAFNTIPSFNETSVYSALQTHHNQGARLHTNSWGNDGTTQYDSLCRGFDRFGYDFEESQTFLAVTNTSTLKNPENAKNLVAVGASQRPPNQGNHCTGGSGPTNDLRRKPEIYAPGCSTVSASSNTSCSTTSATGTSMACPAVAGTGALVRQYFTDGYYPTGVANPIDAMTPSGALIKAVLTNASVDMTGIPGYPSNQEGWGRVLANDALYFPGDARSLVIDDFWRADGLSTGQSYERLIEVTGSTEKLKVTLVWTEPPAAAGANPAYINDLNLVVIAPDNTTTYLGNVFSGGVSVPGGSADFRNNVEQVHINNPATGTWTVRVDAQAVNVGGTQGFALAMTGEVVPDLPPLTIRLPNGAPDKIAPGAPTSFDVEIIPGEEELLAGTLLLVYRYDGGAWQTSPLAPLGADLYQATLPAPDCADTPEFYVTASGDGGSTRTQPQDAPDTVFTAAVGIEIVYFWDDMEIDRGWTVGAPDDDAVRGIWDRADPEGTTNAGQQVQPDEDHTPDPGVMCWVTDSRAGPSAGAWDVDDGKTTLFSPVIDLDGTDAFVSYWRWYSNHAGSAPYADVFEVDITNDGVNWVNVETVGPTGSQVEGGWYYYEFRVSDRVAPTANIQLRFVASDYGSPSLVEAAVDDFLVSEFVCATPDCPADIDGDGTVGLSDLSILLTNFGGPGGPADGDITGDGMVDLVDLSLLLEAFGTDCP